MMPMVRNGSRWVRILCAIALLFVGFAHKPFPALAQPSPAELSQYVLPDGSLTVICLSDHDDGAPHSGGLNSGCEACRLSAAILLPCPPVSGGEAMARTLAVLEPERQDTPHRQLFPPNAAPRAPPLSGLPA